MKKIFPIVIALLAILSCSKNNDNTQKKDVIKIEMNNSTYFVYPIDNGTQRWATYQDNLSTYSHATSTEDGKSNTSKIVNNSDIESSAAEVCYNLEAYGYDDWYLPATNELYGIYLQKDKYDFTFSGGAYLTSTETGDGIINTVAMNGTGFIQSTLDSYTGNFRCVRKD